MKSFASYLQESATTAVDLPQIFLDMDETIVDWLNPANAALKAHGLPEWGDVYWKKYSSEKADDLRWSVINDTPHFWENLPFTDDGKKIWNFVKKYKPQILSACGPHAKDCRAGKHAWIKKHLGAGNLGGVHLVRRAEKKNFAKISGKASVLIDDYSKNCEEYVSAGGFAIQATSASSVIAGLKRLGFT